MHISSILYIDTSQKPSNEHIHGACKDVWTLYTADLITTEAVLLVVKVTTTYQIG